MQKQEMLNRIESNRIESNRLSAAFFHEVNIVLVVDYRLTKQEEIPA